MTIPDNKNTDNKNLVHIGSVLEKALSGYRPRKDLEMTRLWDVWDQALGNDIGTNTKPASFKGGTLQILVSSSAWLHQLQFLEQEMISNLNNHLEQITITRIQYKIGPIQS